MDLVGESARIVSARWWAPAGRSAPGFGARKRDLSGPRGPVPRALASSASSGVSRRPGRRRRRRHRAGGLPLRAAEPGPLRPPPAVRALAAPDRRQPGDRLGPCEGVAARASRWRARTSSTPGTRHVSHGVAAGLASLNPEHRAVIVLRYLLEYTPGEIADLLDLPRGTVNSRLGAGSTGSRRSSTRSTRERRHRHPARTSADPGAGRARCPAPRLAARAGRIREPRAPPWQRRNRGPLVAAVAAAVLLAAAISPPGRALVGSVRDAVTDEKVTTRPALTSLPAPGTLLVNSKNGPWIVSSTAPSVGSAPGGKAPGRRTRSSSP